MSITRYFDLYLNAGKTIPLVINANQYDESEQWVFTLHTDTGVKYTPSSGSIVGIKSDGYLIANAGTVDGQGRVVITETQQMTAAAGKAIFELQIDSETHGTANFIVLVEPDPSNNGIASGSDIGLLRDALNGGLSQAAIEALLACFENVAWIGDDGQDYYDALESALNAVRGISLDVSTLSFVGSGQTQQLTATTVPAGGAVSWESSNTSVATVSSSGLVTSAGVGTATITASSGDVSATCSVTVTQATLVSISAVYTQSGTVYDTDSLDSLKSDLVVTATWSNSSTSTVASTDYTLSGTLTVGTSTVTVTYGGKTTTFSVNVTHKEVSDMTHWADGVAYSNLDVVANQYVRNSDGAIVNYNGWDRTGYVYCQGASTITFNPFQTTTGVVDSGSNYFFASDYSPISAFKITLSSGGNTIKQISVPSNAVYFAISQESAVLANYLSGDNMIPHA